MKVIPRRLYDRVPFDELDINISERNNIIRFMSLTHNQLSSEVFHPMIQYAWYASGYADIHPGPFKTLAEMCFSFNTTIFATPSCNAAPFICCSWCGKPLCFDHFFVNYHFHWFFFVRTFLAYNDIGCEVKNSECSVGWWTTSRSDIDKIWTDS
jgi:hypothetical protein